MDTLNTTLYSIRFVKEVFKETKEIPLLFACFRSVSKLDGALQVLLDRIRISLLEADSNRQSWPSSSSPMLEAC